LSRKIPMKYNDRDDDWRQKYPLVMLQSQYTLHIILHDAIHWGISQINQFRGLKPCSSLGLLAWPSSAFLDCILL
jgi:hypothetical protein